MILALNGEPSTRRWLPSHVYANLEDAKAALYFLISCYSMPGHPQHGPYVLAIDHAGSDQLLGHVGFSPLGNEVEVSYAIAESARGHGFGAEALVHACDRIADAYLVPSFLAVPATENVASRRVLDRASFAHIRDEVMQFQGARQVVSRYCRQVLSVGRHGA